MGLTSSTRNVIRILSANLDLGSNLIYLANAVTIDGSDTTLTSTAYPAFHVHGLANLEGVRLSSIDTLAKLITVSSGGLLTLARAMVERGSINVEVGGVLNIENIRFADGKLDCAPGGKLAVKASHFGQQSMLRSWCDLVLSGNRMESSSGALPNVSFLGPVQTIENNVFVGTDANWPLIFLTGSPESTFRFNTIVNTSSSTGSGYAIWCEEGAIVTSNIVAYNSTSPLSCVAKYSLFDAAGVQEINRGVGNRSADIGTFFKNWQTGDYHLSSNSPALGIGEPGLVTTDLDGNARPIPSGTLPDVGAYEAP
jgi:hypothetical protein